LYVPCKKIRKTIIRNKHRFHNNKTNFILETRKHADSLKNKIKSFKDEKDSRDWLVENVKGIGYKEASHFLRNVGYKKISILDRHILNLMVENGYIKEKPKKLNRKKYLEIEEKFLKIAKKVKMNSAELDLYMWFMKTGKVLK